MIRTLALLASVGSVLVSFWLLSVVTVILPQLGNADQIPFWSVVMVGFFAFGSLSWYAIQHPQASPVLRTLLRLGSCAAVLVGIAVIIENEIRAQRTGDWEGYISLMGIALAGHGVLLLLHLLKNSRAEAPSA